MRMPCASVPAASVFAGLFFEVACRTSPLVLAVVSAGACDRLAVEFNKASQVLMSSAGRVSTPSVSTLPSATGLRSACNWLSALDSIPESEAESEAAGISTGISVGSPSWTTRRVQCRGQACRLHAECYKSQCRAQCFLLNVSMRNLSHGVRNLIRVLNLQTFCLTRC